MHNSANSTGIKKLGMLKFGVLCVFILLTYEIQESSTFQQTTIFLKIPNKLTPYLIFLNFHFPLTIQSLKSLRH